MNFLAGFLAGAFAAYAVPVLVAAFLKWRTAELDTSDSAGA
jgi:hypothetical protein